MQMLTRGEGWEQTERSLPRGRERGMETSLAGNLQGKPLWQEDVSAVMENSSETPFSLSSSVFLYVSVHFSPCLYVCTNA